jgi:hypothetical protein
MVIESTFLFLRPTTPHKTAASLVAPSVFVKDRVPRPQHHAIEFDLIPALYPATGRVKYRLSAGAAQPAGTYTNLVSFIATLIF